LKPPGVWFSNSSTLIFQETKTMFKQKLSAFILWLMTLMQTRLKWMY